MFVKERRKSSTVISQFMWYVCQELLTYKLTSKSNCQRDAIIFKSNWQ